MRKLTLAAWVLLCPAALFASGIYNPGSTGSSGVSVYPATATASFPFGASASTITLTQDNTTVSGGAVNLGQLANVGGTNGVTNGNFMGWRNGYVVQWSSGSVGPSHWVMVQNGSGAGGSLVRVSTVTHGSQYAVQFNEVGCQSPCQAMLRESTTNYYAYLGSSVTLTAWVNSTIGTTIAIGDSIGLSTSTAHPGDGSWRQLSVTRFINPSVNNMYVFLNNEVNPSTSTQYYDGVMMAIGNTPINYTGQIVQGTLGQTSGTNAIIGDVGEYVSSFTASANFPSINVYGDLAAIYLTAGDWDITAIAAITPGGASVAGWLMGVSSTPGNVNTMTRGDSQSDQGATGANAVTTSVPNVRVNLISPTTYYLKYEGNFSLATPTGSGRISARRVR